VVKTKDHQSEGIIVEQVSNLKYLGNAIFGEEKDINVKLRRYNKINGIIKRHF
jgi:hypothetical protein